MEATLFTDSEEIYKQVRVQKTYYPGSERLGQIRADGSCCDNG